MTNIIQRIIDNKNDIAGIRVNGIFYSVDYVMVDEQLCCDEFCPDDIIMRAYQIGGYDNYIEYELSVGQLLVSNVKLYKLQEI